jgi:DNA-binding response OmpR family regulator
MEAIPKRILLVDDDQDFVNLIRIRLENLGYEVEACPDGEMAMKSFRQKKPNAVVLDIEMPQKNGLTTLIELRQENERNSDDGDPSRVPVIVISGLGSSSIKRMIEEVGVYDFLQKPFNTSVLADKIAKAIRA